ncbi:MAG: ABC transporter permease [Psychroflexus sp.]|nr:ABC transporter permease [Psychroflexus sp.]MDR9448081.1 ABC transporter permease [Psychroflexus sp.]
MFSLERWQEVFQTIGKNKLRTILTMISVITGIFILVVLLGVGEGMKNGIKSTFQNDAENEISIYDGVTTVEYKGLNPGRRIQFKNEDYEQISRTHASDIEKKSSMYRIWSGLISYKDESGSYRIEGVLPDYEYIEKVSLISGRFLNQQDQKATEKYMAIGKKVKTDLFGDKEALGKMVEVSGINFKVIGVYTDPGGEREESRVYIPLSTSQKVFGGGQNISKMNFTIPKRDNYEEALVESNKIVSKIERDLKSIHKVAPSDASGIRVRSSIEQTKRFYDLTSVISLFFWSVGVATLFAGIIGVSNIMLIIVKERTKEIGIRKALGAKPLSIIGMVLHESIFVTTIAGFIGLILGLVLLENLGPLIDTEFIKNPEVNLNIAVTTLVLLVFAGALAGFFPARKAAKIKPIVALRDE